MKGAKLNMKEKEIYKVIKDFEQNKIPLKLAIRRSGVSERQLYRKLAIFRKEGIDGFAHKNRGKIPSNKITSLQKNEIKELYETKYYDNSILLFKENLKKNHGIDVSYGWLHKFFMDNLIITNLSHKKTKKRIKKLWWELKNHTNKEDLKIEEQNPELPSIDPHPHPAQKRAEGFGEVWEVDACQEIWLSNEKIHLHGIIDVSTKRIIAAYFDKQETNEAYFKVFRYAFEKYGLPELIISDNRNTFSSSKNRDYTTNSESRTQLQFIFHGLGITTKTTSISQEKPHIERLWRTLKNRWIPLLREWNISTIDEANLRINELINLYNEKFSTPINYTSSKITK
ncbi:DDE-type integrase/transposase/recombinase, partial [Williamsoniiplasma lucivorax]